MNWRAKLEKGGVVIVTHPKYGMHTASVARVTSTTIVLNPVWSVAMGMPIGFRPNTGKTISPSEWLLVQSTPEKNAEIIQRIKLKFFLDTLVASQVDMTLEHVNTWLKGLESVSVGALSVHFPEYLKSFDPELYKFQEST